MILVFQLLMEQPDQLINLAAMDDVLLEVEAVLATALLVPVVPVGVVLVMV